VTTTTTSPKRAGHRVPVDRPAVTKRQVTTRNRGRIAAGIFAVALAGLLAVLVYGNVGQRHTVLAVARTVDPGQVISDADLTVVRIAADPDVHTVASSQRSTIVGQRATVRLLPGSLLTPDSFTHGNGLAAGLSVVGAVVKPGQYPLGLRSGDQVQVVIIGGPAGDRPVDATIVSVASSGGSGGTPISLGVPEDAATRVAAAGAEGRLLLVVPPR